MARTRRLNRYLLRVPAGHAPGVRQALEELTDDAADEMVSFARRFEGTLQRMRVDGLYSPWM